MPALPPFHLEKPSAFALIVKKQHDLTFIKNRFLRILSGRKVRIDHSNDVLDAKKVSGDKVHREFTREGKAGLHRFVKENAVREDLGEVIGLIKAIRFYLLL